MDRKTQALDALTQIFKDLKAERELAHQKAIGRRDAQAFGYRSPRDDVEAEEQMEDEFYSRKT